MVSLTFQFFTSTSGLVMSASCDQTLHLSRSDTAEIFLCHYAFLSNNPRGKFIQDGPHVSTHIISQFTYVNFLPLSNRSIANYDSLILHSVLFFTKSSDIVWNWAQRWPIFRSLLNYSSCLSNHDHHLAFPHSRWMMIILPKLIIKNWFTNKKSKLLN